MKKVIWTATAQPNADNANKLANLYNMGLGDSNKVEVIEISEGWYAIIANEKGAKWAEEMNKAIEEDHAKRHKVGV